MWQALISPVTNLIGGVLDKVVPDAVERDKLKFEINNALINADQQVVQSATAIILAEAKGESWLQRNWRPILMLFFAGLVGAHWLGYSAPNLSEAERLALLEIVKLGISGYIVGRSVEKGIREWKK